MLRQILCALFIAFGCFAVILDDLGVAAQVQELSSVGDWKATRPLAKAHAHNDYEHPRPLLDALDQGFMSIEADVFPVNGELLVAHNLKDVSSEKTLDRLYLRPLYERYLQNQGTIYGQRGALLLLIDIKQNGEAAYDLLRQQLAGYVEMLSVTTNGQFEEKAVTIVVSGDRPFKAISESNPRYVGIDGRLSDLNASTATRISSSLMPLISDNWRIHFRFRGEGDMSEADRKKLREIVSQAHEQGRRIRFWATPDSEQTWQELAEANVDLIGTDDLRRLASFLQR